MRSATSAGSSIFFPDEKMIAASGSWARSCTMPVLTASGHTACMRMAMPASSSSPWIDSVNASTACLVAP